jgi:hypothetical protein
MPDAEQGEQVGMVDSLDDPAGAWSPRPSEANELQDGTRPRLSRPTISASAEELDQAISRQDGSAPGRTSPRPETPPPAQGLGWRAFGPEAERSDVRRRRIGPSAGPDPRRRRGSARFGTGTAAYSRSFTSSSPIQLGGQQFAKQADCPDSVTSGK